MRVIAPLLLLAIAGVNAPAFAQVARPAPAAARPLKPIPGLQPSRPAPAAAPAPAAPAAAAAQPVNRTEFIASMDRAFDLVDANKDGFVTPAELADYRKVTALNAARQRNVDLFRALDADKNGSLSALEFQKLPMNMEPAPSPVMMINDSNGDKKLSKVENRAGTLANFDRTDADKDGVVTPAEMKALPARR